MKKFLSIIMVLAAAIFLVGCGEETTKARVATTTPPESTQAQTTAKPATTETEEMSQDKQAAIAKLDEIVKPLLERLPEGDFKNAVSAYYEREKKYIVDITNKELAKAAATKVVADTAAFANDTLKPLAINKLNNYFNPLIERLPDEDLKASVQSFYDNEIAKIQAVQNLNEIVPMYDELLQDTKDFIAEETERILILLKNKAIEEGDEYVKALIAKIPNEQLKTDVQSFYDREKAKIQNAETIESLKAVAQEVKDDTLDFAVEEMIDISIAELDPYVTALIEKIPFESLKADTQAFYTEEKAKLDKVDTIEGFAPCVQEIKDDLEAFALSEAKKFVKDELDDLVEAGLSKLPNENLRKQLNDFYDEEIAKITAISKLNDVKPTMQTVLEETEAFIKELVISTAKDYLAQLFDYNLANPFDYVPEAMRPTYATNLVDSPIVDFTTGVQVSQMNRMGYGEQWQMIVENLNQMNKIIKALNVVEASMQTVSSAMNIYIENSTTEELEHTIDNETLTASLSFEDGIFYLEVVFKSGHESDLFGTIQPQVKLLLDIAKQEKVIYIYLSDTVSIKYTIGEDLFELAGTYGFKYKETTGSRTFYFGTDVDKTGKRSGHIYEYTTFKDKDVTKACADFYVKDGYVSVVGNKASGMAVTKNYITELYSEREGRLLGYKVQEEQSGAAYHTLWFNIWDISGISSIKVTDKTDANNSGKSTVDTYINGSESLLVPTYNHKTALGITVKTSRKYDVELRTRYYYNIVDGELVVTEAEVPMMFIQDDNNVDTNFTDFPTDFKKDNGIDVSVAMSNIVLSRIRSDYDTLIPLFKENKELMSREAIIEYLNSFAK